MTYRFCILHSLALGGRGWSASRSPGDGRARFRGFAQSGSSPGHPAFQWRWSCLVAVLFVAVPLDSCADERDDKLDRAVVRALDYLVTKQRPSGGWEVDAFGGEATSATSLAVMAFLAAGHVPEEGPYAPALKRGIQYVIEHQQADGLLVSRQGHGPMYCHGISTLMLAEVCGMLEEPEATACREALEKSVRLILTAQNVAKDFNNMGGWRYTTNSRDSDLSVTGWQLLALRSAKNIGCDVPAENIDEAVAYVRRCAQGTTGGFGYQPSSGSSPVLTGTGLTALQACAAQTAEESSRGTAYLKQRVIHPKDPWYFYGVYYCSVSGYKLGDDAWQELKPGLFDTLLAQQQNDGGWRAENGNERPFGTTYSTAMAVLALSVEYGYLPIYQR